MKKILIVMADILDRHSEFTTGARYLKDYFRIEFIICKSWIWNNHNEEIDKNYFLKTNSNFTHTFADNFDELILKIKKSKPDFIFDISSDLVNNEINSLCKKIGCKHVIINNGFFNSSVSVRLWLKIRKILHNFRKIEKKNIEESSDTIPNIKKINKINLLNLFTKLISFIKKKIFSIKVKADIALMAGSEARSSLSKKIEIINIGSNDYYNFKNYEKKQNKDTEEKYILFIDTLLIDNPEDEIQKLGSFFTRYEFMKLHKNLFNHIEEKTNLRIKVAGHRRGKDLEGYEKLFDGREVIFDRTVELSKNCEAVVNSISTAVFFGILYYKPIILYTYDNIDFSPWGPFIYTQSSILGRKIINLEKGKKLENDYTYVDKKKYDDYINKYIFDKNHIQNEQFPFENFIKKFK